MGNKSKVFKMICLEVSFLNTVLSLVFEQISTHCDHYQNNNGR